MCVSVEMDPCILRQREVAVTADVFNKTALEHWPERRSREASDEKKTWEDGLA